MATLFLCCNAQSNDSNEFPQEIDSNEFCQVDCCESYSHGHRFLLGPEAVHVNRFRSKSASQEGWLGGVRFIYEHRRRYCFYWGLEAAYAWGTYTGLSSNRRENGAPLDQKKLKAKENDGIIEGRLGYTFQCKNWWRPEFTPFVGGGYVREINKLIDPSPAHFRTKVTYGFVTAGFLSSISPTDYLTIGFNAKARYIIDPELRITNDPREPKGVKFLMGDDELQYRLELPISYLTCCKQWGVTAIPFFEHRYYGGKKFDPNDLPKISYYTYGATLALAYYY